MFRYNYKGQEYLEGEEVIIFNSTGNVWAEGTVVSPDEAKSNSLSGNSDEFIYIIGLKVPNGIDGFPFGFISIKRKNDLTISAVVSSAPRNNDGRESCFWCEVKTQKRGGGMYDICPQCGR